MALINKKWDKVLELIFNNPNVSFTVRKVSKETKIPTSTAQRYLKELRKESIIDKENKFIYSNYTKFVKSYFMIEKLYRYGLIDYLEKELTPSSIILFGSIRKGEYGKDSDIDIFVESTKEKKLDLRIFERKLKKKIQLFIEPNIEKLDKNLANNILNGIKLSGYFEIK